MLMQLLVQMLMLMLMLTLMLMLMLMVVQIKWRSQHRFVPRRTKVNTSLKSQPNAFCTIWPLGNKHINQRAFPTAWKVHATHPI
jgi:hypothetical protein